MFFSTRDSHLSLTASEAILKGLSDEGGLFLPKKIVPVDYKPLINKDYKDIAFAVLAPYLDDFSSEELKDAISQAYCQANFPEKICDLASFPSYSFLELFHGQTLTFKDMALSLLPHLMEISLKKHPEEKGIHILTATSGDTGSAVLSSFRSSPDISVSVLYPEGGISYIQEKQMLSFTSAKERAYALKKGNFDDCQSLVKKILVRKPYGENFSSANSINIGRLLPQIAYYYWAYLSLLAKGLIKEGQKIDVIVPTGNFGDIFAAYLAKRMSLPFGRLVIASNANRILTDFFSTGVYDIRRQFKKTNSPSMDILISSNLERLLYLTCQSDQEVKGLEDALKKDGFFKVSKDFLGKLQADFSACSASETETEKAIEDCYASHRYLLDPHTAVAYASYQEYQKASKPSYSLIVATASPLKFPLTIVSALGLQAKDDLEALNKVVAKTGIKVPSQLQKAIQTHAGRFSLGEAGFLQALAPQASFNVTVPASSANLGPGFDVCGLALSLFNTFRFQTAAEDSLAGFKGEEELKDNLVLKAYKRFFTAFSLPYQPVRITLIRQEIPISRGLGSSAACIVAGLSAAQEISHRPVSADDCLNLAAEIEGHPDNVACCWQGGFVSSYRSEDNCLHTVSHPVSKKLRFLACIPDEELLTSLARSVLPHSYELKDLTFDAARLVNLPQALKEGNLSLLCEVMEDKIHVPYRLGLIKGGQEAKEICRRVHLPCTISGAGSTLLIVYRQETDINKTIKEIKEACPGRFHFAKLSLCLKGTEIKEEKKNER
jgi:threonine synthase